MFVYSFRASTLKFFGVIALSVAVLIVLVALVPNAVTTTTPTGEGMKQSSNVITQTGVVEAAKEIKYTGIKTNEDRIAFLSQFGWEVGSDALESEEVVIPAEFDQVLLSYNELQKQQGLDLTKYRRKTVMRYTYLVSNYPDYRGTVYANLLIYRNRVIGGDICSAEVTEGFVHGFSPKTN